VAAIVMVAATVVVAATAKERWILNTKTSKDV